MITSFLFAILLVVFMVVVVVVFGTGILATIGSFLMTMVGIGELFNTDNKDKKEGLTFLLVGLSSFIVLVAFGITASNYGLFGKVGKINDYLCEKAKPATIKLEK